MVEARTDVRVLTQLTSQPYRGGGGRKALIQLTEDQGHSQLMQGQLSIKAGPQDGPG